MIPVRPCDIVDIQRKIAYRKERIDHMMTEISRLLDTVTILNDEIEELEKINKKMYHERIPLEHKE